MTTLGDRMKQYEQAYDTNIIGRIPVIVRVDGKGFSKWTKSISCEKPFDKSLSEVMLETMRVTASNIEGCIFAYTQSDEITFILRNDQSLESTPWFNNRVQKIASVISSMVTASFNREMYHSPGWGACERVPPLAYFDARVFAVPSAVEALNYLIWRQNDAVKNSVSSACYYEISKKEDSGRKTAQKLMHGLNQKQQQGLLFQQTGINWNDYPAKFKRGAGTYKVTKEIIVDDNKCLRSSWVIDNELPTFTQDPEFLDRMFYA